MADPYGIIGLTGTVEQLVRFTIFLVKSHKAIKENGESAKKLQRTCEELQSMLNDVSLASFDGANSRYMEAVKREMNEVKAFFEDALGDKNVQGEKSENWVSQHLGALSTKAGIDKLTGDAEKNRQRLLNVIRDENLNLRLDALSQAGREKCRPTIWAQKNPISVCIDLNAKDEDGQPNTCESKLKKAVMQDGAATHVGAITRGQGGVGKTCTLRAIANDENTKKRFPGGVYFLTLGKDASIGTIIQQLCIAVKVSDGPKLASELRAEDNLESVIAGVHNWFREGATLFIFDDVWTRNGISAKVLQILTGLVGNGLVGNESGEESKTSRILYSTRNEKLDIFGETIKFEPRPAQGDRAREILLNVAKAKTSIWDDAECRREIGKVLDKCGGLPLALNVAGSAVRQMKGEAKEVWKRYAEMINEAARFEKQAPGDSYSCVYTMLSSSLKILDENKENEKFVMSFEEMHRSLCVLKRQDWVPLPILENLWELCDEMAAERAVKLLQSVGIAELEHQGVQGGVRLHDLTQDFARLRAENHNERKKWHKKLLDKYHTEDGSFDHTSMVCVNEDENRYVFENIYRWYREAGIYEKVYRVLESARWVISALENGTPWQLEQAVEDLTDAERRGSEGGGGKERRLDRDGIYGMRMIAKAVRLSVSYLDGNTSSLYFQMYGRLVGVCDKSGFVRRFLEDVERCAPKPWVKPVTGCLDGVDGAVLETFYTGFLGTGTVKFSSEGVVACGFGDGGSGVGVVKQNRREGVNEMRFVLDGVSEGPSRGELGGASGGGRGLRRSEVGMKAGQSWRQETMRRLLECVGGTVKCYGRCYRKNKGKKHDHVRFVCSDVCEEFVGAGCSDGRIRIWRLSTKEIQRTITGHTKLLSSICFSADGRRVVSGSWDNTVRVWDVETRDCLLVAERHKWEEIVYQYCGSNVESGNTSSPKEEGEHYYKKDNSVVLRHRDGLEEILAQFDSNIRSFEVDSRKGIVIAGLDSGTVAILKIIK